MLLNIDEDYRITSDNYNFVLQKRNDVKDKDTGEIVDELWRNKTYHNKVSKALDAYMDIKMRESKKRSWPSFIKEVKDLEKKIGTLLMTVDPEPLSRTGR